MVLSKGEILYHGLGFFLELLGVCRFRGDVGYSMVCIKGRITSISMAIKQVNALTTLILHGKTNGRITARWSGMRNVSSAG